MESDDSFFHYGAFRTCPQCGKRFYVSELGAWAYKRYLPGTAASNYGKNQRVWFCSWHCVREFDRETEGKRKHRRTYERTD